MNTAVVISILVFVRISSSSPVEDWRAFQNKRYDQLTQPRYVNPIQVPKTPADTMPLNIPQFVVRTSNSGSVTGNQPFPSGLSDPFYKEPELIALINQANTVKLQTGESVPGVSIQSLAEDPSFVTSLEYKGFLQNVYARLQDLYDEFVKRRDALLNLIYCTNCAGNHTAWQTFMNALAHIPSLGWVARPSAELGKPGISFMVATNENGIVTGVGGTYINNKPIVQYTFNSTHMTPVKPQKPVKPVRLLPPAA